MFSECGFRYGDVLVVYLGFNLGNSLFGRVDGGIPEILHMRDIYGRVCSKVMVRGELIVRVIDVCHCCSILEGRGGKKQNDLYSTTSITFYCYSCNTPRQSCKDVAADSLKVIRRKPVPADNLK
ncbi:hypothetical protein L1987_43359 [Smallanthus sonchifolius]|uniref:Uncharacterized protein n=1 Tax=Smallanthus sonchifolius TaxID=185202 RepID=A0ACB9GLF3_9ASTR|nr:hypothetical protein L1987_43359 [Smallanthus sonchifolius]